ncbi:MAG: hypothetical protein QXP38_12385 [Nitrososphaerota archaeon]
MEQMPTIKKVSVTADKENNMFATVLIMFPVMSETDKENVSGLIRLQNEEIPFNCYSGRLSLVGSNGEHGHKD